MKNIGFIGLGAMGAPMARCLIQAGYELIACDKNPQTREEFSHLGVQVTDKAADCADSNMVIVIVVDDSQVRDVLLGPDGLLEAVDPNRPPRLAIMSTILPQTTREMAGHCAGKNVCVVDAPVSGQAVAAGEGRLSIMVGGAESDLEAMRPVFEAMGENIYHTGALGSGNVTKLVNNIVGLSNMFLVFEAMRLGKEYGLDTHVLASVMETSTGRNNYTKNWDKTLTLIKLVTQGAETAKGGINMVLKDLRHAQELASKKDVDCPLLDRIVRTIGVFSGDEIKEKWSYLLKETVRQ